MDLNDFHGLRVRDVMDSRTWDLPLIEYNTNIKMAMILLIGRGYGWVVKGKKSMELIGVITEHDALSLLKEKGKGDVKKVRELMTPNPVTCYEDEKVNDVIKKWRNMA